MTTVAIDTTLNTAVRRALAISHLRNLDARLTERILEGSTARDIQAGRAMREAGEPGPHVEVVLSGLLRVDVPSPDGRSLTVRYARPGGLLGVASLFRPSFSMPGSIHALVDSRALSLRPDIVRRLADEDLAVAGALLDELSERVVAFVSEFPGSAFATVRQRVARHLLDVASETQHGPDLVARLSQQQLASGVGSVREVVVRVLRELREEGIVETRAGAIWIVDPGRLFADTFLDGAEPAGT